MVKSQADFNKPFIAVCNSFVQIIPGHAHLAVVGKKVRDAIYAAGGIPFEFNTIGVDDGIAMGHVGMKYSLASRELIADSVETMLRAHCFDGVVCIPNCDKIVPGMMMGAARVNIPSIFVSGGPMKAGKAKTGEAIDLATVFEGVGKVSPGTMSLSQLQDIEENACPTCGSCSGMFTANSMNCLNEALGQCARAVHLQSRAFGQISYGRCLSCRRYQRDPQNPRRKTGHAESQLHHCDRKDVGRRH